MFGAVGQGDSHTRYSESKQSIHTTLFCESKHACAIQRMELAQGTDRNDAATSTVLHPVRQSGLGEEMELPQ